MRPALDEFAKTISDAYASEGADALRKTVRTYPTSEFYDLEKLLTEVGIDEAR